LAIVNGAVLTDVPMENVPFEFDNKYPPVCEKQIVGIKRKIEIINFIKNCF
jgi:hypothetical protein